MYCCSDVVLALFELFRLEPSLDLHLGADMLRLFERHDIWVRSIVLGWLLGHSFTGFLGLGYRLLSDHWDGHFELLVRFFSIAITAESPPVDFLVASNSYLPSALQSLCDDKKSINNQFKAARLFRKARSLRPSLQF